jgi:single-stranded DNA-binding protein
MGNMLFIGTDLRVASEVTFIPGADPKRNHAILTVINNRGKNPRTQEDMTDEITLNFWNKYAGVAAHYLYPGKQINVEGRIQSYTEDTGQVRPNGGRKLNRKIEVVVTNMQLLGDSMKKINERIAKNVAILKQAGRLPAEVILTGEEILKSDKMPMTDFSPAIATQTGRYGLARVWTKDRNFWDQNLQAAQTVQTPVNAPIDMTNMAAIASQIENLQRMLAAGAAPVAPPVVQNVAQEVGAGEDPFAAGA